MGVRPKPTKRLGTNRLSHQECWNARPAPNATKIEKLWDGGGLYLAVMPSGARLWRMKYRHDGKEKIYSIGKYPTDVTLEQARDKRDAARKLIKVGKDPTIARRVEKAATTAAQGETFKVVAEEWLRQKHAYSPGHRAQTQARLHQDLFPTLGDLPIAEIKTTKVLDALRKIELRGAHETARKCKVLAGQIFRYSVVTERRETDPVQPLKDEFRKRKATNRATVPLAEMPKLLKKLAKADAELSTQCLFAFVVLTACRTGEARFATWAEVDGNRWCIPAARTKMREEHVVPLSTQALRVLKAAKKLRQSPELSALVFPGYSDHGALSENALLALLRRAGYLHQQTTHGFRASFSTWANEVLEANHNVIEACLAHAVPGVAGDYNRASYLRQRAVLMQQWADQLVKWGLRIP